MIDGVYQFGVAGLAVFRFALVRGNGDALTAGGGAGLGDAAIVMGMATSATRIASGATRRCHVTRAIFRTARERLLGGTGDLTTAVDRAPLPSKIVVDRTVARTARPLGRRIAPTDKAAGTTRIHRTPNVGCRHSVIGIGVAKRLTGREMIRLAVPQCVRVGVIVPISATVNPTPVSRQNFFRRSGAGCAGVEGDSGGEGLTFCWTPPCNGSAEARPMIPTAPVTTSAAPSASCSTKFEINEACDLANAIASGVSPP